MAWSITLTQVGLKGENILFLDAFTETADKHGKPKHMPVHTLQAVLALVLLLEHEQSYYRLTSNTHQF